MRKGFERVIRGKLCYERVSERLERKKHGLLFARVCDASLLHLRRHRGSWKLLSSYLNMQINFKCSLKNRPFVAVKKILNTLFPCA